jgi:hypothetical protein
MESAKRMHKFKVGQSVSLQSTLCNRDAASGAYKMTKQLPARDCDFQNYCRAALAAFGDSGVISARQVENAKERQRSKSFRMP